MTKMPIATGRRGFDSIPVMRPQRFTVMAGALAPSYAPPARPAMGQVGDVQNFINASLSAMTLYEQTQGMDPAKLQQFKNKFQECESSITSASADAAGAVQIAAGVYCLDTLYKDVKKAIDELGSVPPGLPKPAPAPSGGFPVVPVLVGGGLAVAGIIAAILIAK